MYGAPAEVSLKLIALVVSQSFAQGQHHANEILRTSSPSHTNQSSAQSPPLAALSLCRRVIFCLCIAPDDVIPMPPMTSREPFKTHPRICISYEPSSMFSPQLVHVAIFNSLGFWPPRLCSVLYKSWQHSVGKMWMF